MKRFEEVAGAFAEGDIIDRLIELADTTPDLVLYIELMDGTNESARITAGELRDQAAALATTLHEGGLERGDVVLLIATPPVEFLIGFFGCLWAGVLSAPVAFPRRPEHIQSRLEPVLANATAKAVVAATPQGPEQAVLDVLTQGELPVFPILVDPSTPAAPPAADRDHAYLQYTSGSTTDPRGVIITHVNLRSNLAAAGELLDYDATSKNVSWCPLTHDMGLVVGALPAVAFGFTAVLMPPIAFIKRPFTWMKAFDTYKGTHGTSPNFGYDLSVDRSTPEERAELDLSAVRSLANGAEPIRRRTGDRFLEAFAVSGMRPEAYCPGYGLAEATVVVASTPVDVPAQIIWVDADALERNEIVFRNEGEPGVRELVLDGTPASEYSVKIVDPATGKECASDRVGELWLRGPSVSPGYWRRPEMTAEAFGGVLEGDDGGPYLRTGDLAFLHEGYLVICGREKDLIIVRGRNIHPHDVELTAELAHPAVRSGGSAAFAVELDSTEALAVVAEVDGEPNEAEVVKAIKEAVFREFELNVADVVLVGPQTLPKTTSGKKQRSATKDLWELARMTSS